MAEQAPTIRRERTLTPRVHTRPGPEDTQGGLVGDAGRRDFLRLTMLGSLAAMTLGGLGAFIAFFIPQRTSPFGSKIKAGTLDEIKDDEVKVFREGKFWLARFKDSENGGQSVLIALYWKCAHLGCTVPWKGEESFQQYKGVFHCPCHGSIYTRTGQNVGGPAPKPLDYMEITITGKDIVVDSGKRITRQQHDPKSVTVIGS